MQAIRTRYIPATNTKPSYFVAQAEAGRIKISYDYTYNGETNHLQAALEYANKFHWLEHGETLVGGQFENDFYWTISEKK